MFYRREQWGATPVSDAAYIPVKHNGMMTVHYTAGDITPSVKDAVDPGRKPEKPGVKWYQVWRDKNASRKARRNASRAIRKYNRAMKEYNRKLNPAVPAWILSIEQQVMRNIQAFHMRADGLDNVDIAYHKLFFASGNVYEGRPLGKLGSHTRGWNHTIGYSFVMGPGDRMTTAMKVAFYEHLKIDGIREYTGHRQRPGNYTACPGDEITRVLGLK